MPFVIPPLVKLALAASAERRARHLAVREMRRINDELERVKAQPAIGRRPIRQSLPTCGAIPRTGEWRVI